MNDTPVRIAKKFDAQDVINVICDEMSRWGQRNERGALGVVLGRLLEKNRVSERGLLVNYPAWLVGGNKNRKRRKGSTP